MQRELGATRSSLAAIGRKRLRILSGRSMSLGHCSRRSPTNRVGHAYLFTGARGVGKTSAARILAKALNCVAGADAHALQ